MFRPAENSTAARFSDRRRVLIAGYFGFDNTGDEAILDSMLARLRNTLRDLSFIVISGDPEATSAEHQVDAIHYKNISEIISEIQRCHLVIIGGGGLFHDYLGFDPSTCLTRDHWSFSLYNTLSLLSTLFNKPLMISSVGVGPLFSDIGRQHTLSIFEQSSVATVRDDESKEILTTLGFDQ